MNTIILGMNNNIHDGSLSLMINGKLVSALSVERYLRSKKHYKGNDKNFIDYFLKLNDLTYDDITHITFTDMVDHGDLNFIKFYDHKTNEIQNNLNSAYLYKPFNIYYGLIGDKMVPAYHIHHQLAHASYAFYTSPFNESHCLTLDASWYPHATSLVARGRDNKIEMMYTPNLFVGVMYNRFTEYMGLGDGIYKAGSLMGLSSYGTPIKEITDNWKSYTGMYYGDYWHKIINEKRLFSKEESDGQLAMNVAATLQNIFENEIIETVNGLNHLNQQEQSNNLCLSGGSFLNCNVNYKISKIKNTHISPACGDDGLSAGSSLYLAHNIMGYDRFNYSPKDLMYLGGNYPIPQNIGSEYNPKEVAEFIKNDGIVAWYQGKSEFGPRALGNRSLLANPTNPKMKDILNDRIKKREWFRPFAPSVLIEKYQDWFDNPEPSPFMLYTSNVKKPNIVPSITHVDGTARIQTVDKDDNHRYWELIKNFDDLTGVPMLLNTSLNINGEPIVETPDDAIRFLKETDSDGLVLGNKFILKENI